jgi:hypothetical protein
MSQIIRDVSYTYTDSRRITIISYHGKKLNCELYIDANGDSTRCIAFEHLPCYGSIRQIDANALQIYYYLEREYNEQEERKKEESIQKEKIEICDRNNMIIRLFT